MVTIDKEFVEQNASKRFNITFSEEVQVVIAGRYKTVKKLNSIGFFIGTNSNDICYKSAKQKWRGFSLAHLPVDKIVKMEDATKVYSAIENAKKILKKIHPNVWPNLQKEMQDIIDGKEPEQDFNWHFAGKLTFVDITTKFDSFEREHVKKRFKEAFENKTEYSWSKTARGPQGRDLSASVQIGTDGAVRAFYSSEFPGCGNGDYYLLLNPTTAIYYERD